jgi:ATP-dependent protease Clp ATPase subunit
MFEIPSRSDIDEVVVTREAVLDGKPPIYVMKRREGQRRRSERRVEEDLDGTQAREA